MNTSSLTAKEKEYWSIISVQYLVLLLKGRPGLAKSAIAQSIANKLGLELIDLRIPTMDEVDLGVFPKTINPHEQLLAKAKLVGELFGKESPKYKAIASEYEQMERAGSTIEHLTHPVPEWAYKTLDKTKNFLIVFEEFNRAPLAVRNAAMGVMLERRVGFNFTFGDNVYMLATGNIGSEDGTDVEELDNAQKSRFITKTHEMSFSDWYSDWASKSTDGVDNIHESVLRYLKSHPVKYYPDLKEQDKDVICNPRTWTALSKYIQKNMPDKLNYKELTKQAPAYIGKYAVEFVRFLQETERLTIQDVLEGKRSTFKEVFRENKVEVMKEIQGLDVCKIKPKELTNIINFLKEVDEDTLGGFLFDWFSDISEEDGQKVVSHKNFQTICETFKPIIDRASKGVDENTK